MVSAQEVSESALESTASDTIAPKPREVPPDERALVPAERETAIQAEGVKSEDRAHTRSKSTRRHCSASHGHSGSNASDGAVVRQSESSGSHSASRKEQQLERIMSSIHSLEHRLDTYRCETERIGASLQSLERCITSSAHCNSTSSQQPNITFNAMPASHAASHTSNEAAVPANSCSASRRLQRSDECNDDDNTVSAGGDVFSGDKQKSGGWKMMFGTLLKALGSAAAVVLAGKHVLSLHDEAAATKAKLEQKTSSEPSIKIGKIRLGFA
jgi:hypothetical protein